MSELSQIEIDRERYRELLEELRLVLPGVQVLFGFLLTVPFSNRFGQLDDVGRNVFGAALLGVAVAAVTLMTPAAYHRLAPHLDRSERLGVGVALTLIGMSLIGLSMSAAVFVVVRFLYDSNAWGIAFGAITLVAVIGFWFAMPLGQVAILGRKRASSAAQ